MTTQKILRPIGALLAGALALVGFTACSSAPDEASGGSELQEVTLRLHFSPDGSMSTLYAAEALGYFAEEGIDLQIGVGKGSQAAVNEVAQGQSDFATAGAVNVMIGAGQGQEVESIGMWTGKSSYGFLIPEDSDVDSVTDLAGRSVIVGTGTPFAALLPAVLQENGVDPSSVEVISVDASALVQTYASGTGDAIATAIPFAQPLVDANRPSRALAWEDLGFAIPDYSFVANTSFVQENPELVRGFLRAMFRGIVASANDPSIGLEALKKAQPEVNLAVAEQQLQAYLPYYCSDDGVPYGSNDSDLWAGSLDLLTQAGVVGSGLDAAALYTNDYLPEGDSSLVCPIIR